MKHVRVSEILGRLFPYTDVDPIVLEEKGKIGTNVHEAIKQDCSDGFVVIETDRAQAYFDSYKLWKCDVFVPIRQIERLYCDKLMLTGECDGLLQNLGPDRLLDWKCSASPNLEAWKMQAHYYWYLLRENGYSIADTMMWINLKHSKHIRKDKRTNLGTAIYTPLEPVVYEFKFDEEILSRCIDEANKYWEEKSCAVCID